MCTVVVWGDNGQTVASSRNMDWFEGMETELWVVPAGRDHVAAGPQDPNPLQWTSKYGSVIASVYNIGTADGMNEKGLAAHLLWLADSEYGPRDDSMPGLVVSLWAQYYLDNFATVAEAVASYNEAPFQVITAEIAGRDATVHLQISDATGDVAIFEILDGKMVIHQGAEYPVITNSPPFAEQLANLKLYQGFGGDKPLPGTTAAADRFVRASYYRKQLEKPATVEMALAELLSVLRNAAQPYSTPASDQPNIAPTIWRSLIDHENVIYYFESTSSPYLVWLDLKKLDLSPGAPVQKLKLADMVNNIGEQNQALTDTPLFNFSIPISA